MAATQKKKQQEVPAPQVEARIDRMVDGDYKTKAYASVTIAWTGEHRQRISEDLKRKRGIYHLWPERGAEQQRPQFRPKQRLYRRSGDPLGGTGAIPWEPFARS